MLLLLLTYIPSFAHTLLLLSNISSWFLRNLIITLNNRTKKKLNYTKFHLYTNINRYFINITNRSIDQSIKLIDSLWTKKEKFNWNWISIFSSSSLTLSLMMMLMIKTFFFLFFVYFNQIEMKGKFKWKFNDFSFFLFFIQTFPVI